jgi:exodeoxyribonuclease VII large subunit
MMIITIRVDLNVPYVEKDDAKALGAQFDWDRRVWFAPPGTDLSPLERWLPEGFVPSDTAQPDEATEPEKGMALMDVLAQVRAAIERALPEVAWVRAEISELSSKRGHSYLKLTQRNERGDILAQAKGIIWKYRAETVTAKFEQATGEGLRTDIKILCLAKVRFDMLYGLDLIIEDIDPSYTLGDLAAKLARIRERLQRERIFDRNKRLPAPVEFVRVAVISPETSAGLGDFRRETDRLQDAGLCEFVYFHASFQGTEVSASFGVALDDVMTAHAERPFDALAIIRGGGTVTDLAWLNDLEVARRLCECPIPVLTGIGHERDNTILDEIAHRRFDTPSKVALHITQTVRDNAFGALAALEQIRLQVGRILSREQTTLAAQADRVRLGVRSMLTRAGDAAQQFSAVIRTATHFQLREASQAAEAECARLLGAMEQTLCEADLRLTQSIEAIAHRSRLQLGEQRSAIEKLANSITLQSQAAIRAADLDLGHLKAQMGRDAIRVFTKAADDLDCDLDAVVQGARALVEAARREIEASNRIVVGLGPQATLRRGFAIAKDSEDRPITSRKAAMRSREFSVQFHDGTVPVANRDFDGENVR